MATGETSLAESNPSKTLSDIVGPLVSVAALTDEALMATEHEIAMLSAGPDLTEEERQILHAVLAAVQKERVQRKS